MSQSFDPTLPTPMDTTRLLIGDTGETAAFLLTDQVIKAVLTFNAGSIYGAAAALADGLAARYSARVNLSVDGLSVSNSDRAKAFRDLASRLRSQAITSAAGGLGTPYVAGISVSDMTTNAENADRVEPAFRRGQFDNPQNDDVADYTLGEIP